MTIAHHPGDEAMLSFAAGRLDEARGLVVASHVSLCAACRRRLRAFQRLCGAVLDETPPEPMSPGAFERLLPRLDEAAPAAPPAPAPADWRSLVERFPLGPWRWIGPGVRMRSVGVAGGDARAFLLAAKPGIRLPHHRHTGAEWTCVFEGAFSYGEARFGPGDFDEADESVEHKPFVEESGPCLCLVAMQGGITLQSRLGRLLQPLLRL